MDSFKILKASMFGGHEMVVVWLAMPIASLMHCLKDQVEEYITTFFQI